MKELVKTALLVGSGVMLLSLSSCRPSGGPQLVSVELEDTDLDGMARQDEALRITLASPLPPGFSLDSLNVLVEPSVVWRKTIERTSDPRVLRIRVLTGTPQFRPHGIYGRDTGSTRVGVDFGDGAVQWADLQTFRVVPVLTRVIWEERDDDGHAGVVDQGDSLRLVFNGPVILTIDEEGRRVRVPEDIILSKPNADRLDDGEVPSIFTEGDSPNEVRIILGSRPSLTVSDQLPEVPTSIARFGYDAPSGLAVNGTSIIPMAKIVDRRGGPGVRSDKELDIEFMEDFALPSLRQEELLPEPSARSLPTITPFLGWKALVVGGFAAENNAPLDQVLLYDPLSGRVGSQPFKEVARLRAPTASHTATLLVGPDGISDTGDDFVVIAGGTDGSRYHDTLTVILGTPVGNVEVYPLDVGLLLPRAEHAAAAIGSSQLLVDGGINREGILGCAELLTFYVEDREVQVSSRRVFRSLERMQHTLTPLPAGPNGVYALAYGGYGRNRKIRPHPSPFGEEVEDLPPPDAFFPMHDSSVLVSPVLIRVDDPRRSISELKYEFRFALLRRRQSALALPFPQDSDGDTSRVVIVGGTSSHVLKKYDGSPKDWEMPIVAGLPQGHETGSAVLFHFDPREPERSDLEVVAHPAPDPGQHPERVHFSAVSVPGYGILFMGGESSNVTRHDPRLRSIEIFLEQDRELANTVYSLTRGRSRHGAYCVDRNEIRAIFVIGGITGGADTAASIAVEEIPLPSRERNDGNG